MINDTQLASVLILAFDEVTEESAELASVLSGAYPEETETEKAQTAAILAEYDASDINRKGTRIPIIIDDRLIPAHHTGSSTHTYKGVTYDDGNVVTYESTNSVSVRLNIRSSLTKLSSVISWSIWSFTC